VRYEAVTDEREKISYLRAKAINTLINACKEIFLGKEKEICEGKFDSSLVDVLDESIAKPLKEIQKISIAKVYRSKSVLQIEAAGFNVVAELLDIFITAVNDQHIHGKELRKNRPYSEKVISLLPAQFIQNSEGDLYIRILRVCEFVAGMTDSYAVTLYRRLKGIELPM
jgi:dGTPase